MFPYQGPTNAARTLKDLMRFHGSAMPELLAEKLDAAVDQASPVLATLYGMEWLWSAFAELDAEGAPVTIVEDEWRESALQTLGVLAAEIGYGRHQEKGPRGEAIAAWVAQELEGSPGLVPGPDVDTNYLLTSPAPQAPPGLPAPED